MDSTPEGNFPTSEAPSCHLTRLDAPNCVILTDQMTGTDGATEISRINTRCLLQLISQPYPEWINFRFSQDFDFKNLDDQVAFIDDDMKDIDERIAEIISELQDIIDNHGEKITATIEKELITLIFKIKKSQIQSLFGRKAALALLTIFLSNFISDH